MTAEQPKPSTSSRRTDRGVLAIVRSLQAGELSAASLGTRERRQLVEHLTNDGLPVVEIADILKVSDRTVTRMRKKVREANAVDMTPRFTAQIVGMVLQQGEVNAARCRRVYADPKVDASTRVEAARACWQIHREMVQLLQSTGHVASVPRWGRDPLNSHVPSPDELEAQLREIQILTASTLVLTQPPPSSQHAPAGVQDDPAPAPAPTLSTIQPVATGTPDAKRDTTFTIIRSDSHAVTHPLTGETTRPECDIHAAVCKPVPEAPPPTATGELPP
jgi:hypothetical protein